MCKDEKSPPNDIIERAEKEYEHVTAELARYDSDSQKIVSFISLLITTAFIIGVEKQIPFVFPIVPIIAIMVIQYLLSNNYAYRVREMYVYKLEDILRRHNGQVPGLYKNQIRKHFQELTKTEMLLLPFSGSVLYTVALVIIISVFSVYKSYSYINIKFSNYGALVYLFICLLMVVYTIMTSLWSTKRLSKEYKQTTT